MTASPTLAEFRSLAQRYTVVPVWRDLLADTVTPVGIFRRLGSADGSVLLESVEGGDRWGRYSFIGLDPITTLLVRGSELTWTDGPICPVPAGASLAETLRVVRQQLRAPELPELPLLSAGAICVLGGDALHTEPSSAPAAGPVPDSAVIFPGTMILFDHFQQRLRLVAKVVVDPRRPIGPQYAAALSRLDDLAARMTTVDPPPPMPLPKVIADPEFHSDVPDEEFRELIESAQRRVAAGELRQVNISRRFGAAADVDPLSVYRVLRTTNPSPYMYLIRLPGVTLAGSSPQALLRVRDRAVTTYALAGTRPRGADPAADAKLAAELAGDAKERAEHGMLVDLAVADLTPVARPGTVRVTDRERVVRYSRVMHLVTEVTGELADGQDAVDALAAVFPAGTVSGTPRAAALRVIDALEPRPRGLYGGAVGYVDFAGNLDMCIGVRALQFRDGAAYCQAAAGVVAGSVPELEVQESRVKARALFVALASAAAAGDGLR